MARTSKKSKSVETFTHKADSRRNIPTAECHSVLSDSDKAPIRVAYERRNRDLDPQLVWCGKDEQDASDLVIQTPPLYIQEKMHPKVLIDELVRETQERREQESPPPPDLFADFNGLPSAAARTEYYRHDANWSNRMILGDSLQVMASLAEREGLRGKVQCIYIDPPYGIRFNSNFQWSTTSRDVKDGKAEHITRETEQVKAFRDTWRDGIHSYLTYLRDRLTVARELLTESGSIFVQIGDENLHRVRVLMDEIFGEENFVVTIKFSKTSGLGGKFLDETFDYLIWFSRKIESLKFRRPFLKRILGKEGATQYTYIMREDSSFCTFKNTEKGKPFSHDNLTSQTGNKTTLFSFQLNGIKMMAPKQGGWKSNEIGIERLKKSNRIIRMGNTPRYVRYFDDAPYFPMGSGWKDTGISGFGAEKKYVVETHPRVIARCILMSTDPGDLVMDPTCGSGTTAYVAEQWGRRWIAIDTSRVALALARMRIMGARYPWYLLADSREGRRKQAEISLCASSSTTATHDDIRQGFVYERVPHITLKSIANNADIDVIWDKWQETIEPLRAQLNAALNESWEEWEIPREANKNWPEKAINSHNKWWQKRIDRQKEIDASIAAKADYEYLYDKPYTDKERIRVAGPFTVESLSPHRMLAVDESGEFFSTRGHQKHGYGEAENFSEMILENLKTAGLQQAHKQDRIAFISLEPWPGQYICAEGCYMEGSDTRRAGILIGPEFGTVTRPDLAAAAREAAEAAFDVLVACAFSYDPHVTDFNRLGRIPILKAR
ncbi:MAG: site-specific DNA-methyltransferase, partial [Bryobacterales bacterium]|nr:site-specific DNA-methyltransferase [Bryobacterales bacterium]